MSPMNPIPTLPDLATDGCEEGIEIILLAEEGEDGVPSVPASPEAPTR